MVFIESQTINEKTIATFGEQVNPDYKYPFSPRADHKRWHCKQRDCLMSDTLWSYKKEPINQQSASFVFLWQ